MLSFASDSSSALLNRLDLILGSFYSLIFPRLVFMLLIYASVCVCVCVCLASHILCVWLLFFNHSQFSMKNLLFTFSARIKKWIDICIGIEKSVSSTILLIEILVVYKMYKKIDLFHTLRTLLFISSSNAISWFRLLFVFIVIDIYSENRNDVLLTVMLIIFLI